MQIVGYAIKWDDEARIDGQRERFQRGAFSAWLARGSPCVLTYGHCGAHLAWSRDGTLTLYEDATGLLISADLRHAVGIDLSPIRNGLLTGFSLGFQPYREEKLHDGTRLITEAMASEIAIVSAPAYRASRFIVSDNSTQELDIVKTTFRTRLALEKLKLAPCC